jgi:putative membrane protein
MVSLFAFLHHLAAFTLIASLAVVKGELTVASARKLQLADLIFGISAVAVLIIGFSRVFYFEKGAFYYFHSMPFVAKLSPFAVVGLLSIYPTVQFLSWRESLKQGLVPSVVPAKMHSIRSIIHWELVGVVFIILCAVLMARGVGYVGA